MPFIHDDFILQNETAKRLYRAYAKDLPIIDYHCHLSPEKIANNYRFIDAYDFLGAVTIINGVKCVPMAFQRNRLPEMQLGLKSGSALQRHYLC